MPKSAMVCSLLKNMKKTIKKFIIHNLIPVLSLLLVPIVVSPQMTYAAENTYTSKNPDEAHNLYDPSSGATPSNTKYPDGYWTKIDDDTWTYTFYVENANVDWYVWEDAVPGYTGDVTITNPGKIDSTDTSKNITITNKKDDLPGTGSLTLTKDVVKEDGSPLTDTSKSFTFTITLTDKNDNAITGTAIYGNTAFKDGVAKVTLKDEETLEFTDIPAGYHYSIDEATVSGYVSSGATITATTPGLITEDEESEVTWTNKKSNIVPSTVNFSLKKKVTSNAPVDTTKYHFTVALNELESLTDYSYSISSNETTFTTLADGSADIELELAANEIAIFKAIPVNSTYMVLEDAGNYTSSYDVTDANNLGKINSSHAGNTEKNQPLNTVTEKADEGENVTITFTNDVYATESLKISKIVLNEGGTVSTTDTETYNVDISLSGLAPNTRYITDSGAIVADEDGNAFMTVYVKNGETITLNDLPVGTKYTVAEQANNKMASYEITDINNKNSIVKVSDANTEVNRNLSTSQETIDNGEEATITFTNKPYVETKKATVQIVKYDNETDKHKLTGAVYDLYQGTEKFIQNFNYIANPSSLSDIDVINNLNPGEYVLIDSNGIKTVFMVRDDYTNTIPSDLTEKAYDLYEVTDFAKIKTLTTGYDILGNPSSSAKADNLTATSYYLIETAAPEGYLLDENKIPFTISKTDLDTTITMALYDGKLIILPNTGGNGTIIFSLIALLLICGFAVFSYKTRKTIR